MASENNYGRFFQAARGNSTKPKKPAPKKNADRIAERSDKSIVEEKIQQMKAGSRARRKSFPLTPIVATIICVIAGLVGYFNYDKVENFLTKIEIRLLGEASAESSSAKTPEKKDATKTEKAEKVAAEDSSAGKTQGPSTKGLSEEQLSVFAKLEDRKKQLDQREVELTKLDEELQKQKVVLEERIKTLEELRGKIATQLEEKVQVDKEKVDTLVDVYSNMKPQNAAKVFEAMNEDLAVEVLTKMKKKSSADILNLLTSDKAQRLTEKFAGYKRK